MSTSGNNILGTNPRNKNFFKDKAVPDTDSRFIEMSAQGISVTPNLKYGHAHLIYTCPVSVAPTITVNNFINPNDKGLYRVTLNNASNAITKSFVFSAAYVFLDNMLNTIAVSAGKTAVFFGCIINGKMYLRESVDSTN
jgi:hypothetical protein